MQPGATPPLDNTSTVAYGFTLAQCPRRHVGSHPTNPHASHYAGWKLTQNAGRILRLVSLHQYDTYGGMLCGLPTAQDHHFEWAAARALDMYAGGIPADQRTARQRHIRLMPPELLTGDYMQRAPDGSLHPRHWTALPPTTCIARFDSGELAPHAPEAFSSVIVVWWQAHYGPPDARATTQLTTMPWEAFAWGWMP